MAAGACAEVHGFPVSCPTQRDFSWTWHQLPVAAVINCPDVYRPFSYSQDSDLGTVSFAEAIRSNCWTATASLSCRVNRRNRHASTEVSVVFPFQIRRIRVEENAGQITRGQKCGKMGKY